jgi:SAM-dependent methyltransferase
MKTLTWTPALVKRFWDDLADTDFLAGIAFSRFAAPYLVELCQDYLTEQSLALDFGGGFNSYLARELLKKAVFVKIYEPSLHESQLVDELRQNPRFLGIDSTMASNAYDLIFAVEVIEHLFDEDIRTVLQKIRAGLKTDGVFVVTSPNQEDLLLSSRYCPVCQHLFHPWGHLRSFTKDSLRNLLENSGFTCDAIFDVDFSNARLPIEELKTLKRTLIAQAEEAGTVVSSSELSEKVQLLMESVAAWKKLGSSDLLENPGDGQIGAGGTLVAFASTRVTSETSRFERKRNEPQTSVGAQDTTTQAEVEAIQRILQVTQAERRTIQQTLQATQAELEVKQQTLRINQAELQASQQNLQSAQAELQTIHRSLENTRAALEGMKHSFQDTRSDLQMTRQILQNTQAELLAVRANLTRYQEFLPIRVLRKLRKLFKNER